MIIIDLYQILISVLSVSAKSGVANSQLPGLVRHIALTAILGHKKRFLSDYGGELIIASDSPHTWREDIFPHYKAHRKIDRDDTGFWGFVRKQVAEMSAEFKEVLPYRVLIVPKAEADDIIAALCNKYGIYKGEAEDIMIVSGDKDLKQLQKYSNVSQYDPVRKKNLVVMNPEAFLQELIISGDKGDGIPNILSDDDAFVNGIRQKPIQQAKLNNWVRMSPDSYCSTEMLIGYKRNKNLIDFSCIPEYIINDTLSEFSKPILGNKKKLMDYIIENRLEKIMVNIGEF